MNMIFFCYNLTLAKFQIREFNILVNQRDQVEMYWGSKENKEDQINRIFQDPNNPAANPQHPFRQNYLNLHGDIHRDGKLSINLPFEPKKSITAKCSNIIYCNYYYRCIDCAKHEDACICEQCFKNGDHLGHRVEKKYSQQQYGFGTCDCGISDIWKASGFCKFHKGDGLKENELEEEPSQAVIDQFCDYSKAVFEVIFHLYDHHENNYYTKMISSTLYISLTNLINNSTYYQIVTIQMLRKVKFDENDLLQLIIRKYGKFFLLEVFQFLNGLLGVENFVYDIIKRYIFYCNEEESFLTEGKNSQFLYQLQAFHDVMKQLAEKENCIFMLASPTGFMSTVKTHLENVQEGDNMDWYWKAFTENHGVRTHFYLIEDSKMFIKFVTAVKNEPEFFTLILHDLFQCEDELPYEKICERFLIILVAFNKGRLNMILSSQEFQHKFQIYEGKLLTMFQIFFKNTHKATSDILLIGLAFAKKYPILKSKVPKWLISNCSDHDEEYSYEYAEKIVQFSISILKSVVQKQNFLGLLLTFSQEQIEKQKIQQMYMDCIKEFAYEVKKSYYTLSEIKSHFIEQEILTKALKKTAKFDNQKKLIYASNQEYPSPLLRFFIRECQRQFKLGCDLKLINFQKQILLMVFNEEYIVSLCQMIELLSVITETRKQNSSLILSLFKIYFFAETLYERNHPLLKQLMKKIMKNKQFRIQSFPSCEQDRSQVYSILQIQKDQIVPEKQDKNPEQQKRKIEKMTQVKQKKLKLIKKKQNKILKENPEEKIEVQKGNQDHICLICHQKSLEEDSLCFISYLKHEDHLHWIAFSEVEYLQIKSCNHQIHAKCFFEMDENEANCPLCKRKSNIILPVAAKQIKQEKEEEGWEIQLEYLYSEMKHGSSLSSVSILLNSLIYQMGIKQILLKKEKLSSKTDFPYQKVFNLIATFGVETLTNSIEQIQHKIEDGQQVLATYSLLLIVQLVKYKLFSGSLELIQKRTNEVVQNLDKTEIKYLFQSIYDFTGFELEKFISQDNAMISRPSIFRDLFSEKQFPKTLTEFLTVNTLECSKCKQFDNNTWSCLLCGEGGCSQCVNEWSHCEQTHGSSLILNHQSATLSAFYSKTTVQKCIYSDQFKQEWTKSMKTEGFYLDESNIHKCYLTFILGESVQ